MFGDKHTQNYSSFWTCFLIQCDVTTAFRKSLMSPFPWITDHTTTLPALTRNSPTLIKGLGIGVVTLPRKWRQKGYTTFGNTATLRETAPSSYGKNNTSICTNPISVPTNHRALSPTWVPYYRVGELEVTLYVCGRHIYNQRCASSSLALRPGRTATNCLESGSSEDKRNNGTFCIEVITNVKRVFRNVPLWIPLYT